MKPPPEFRLKLTPTAEARWKELERSDPAKYKKVTKALRFLKNNPAHPGLHAHKWDVLKGKAPDGGDMWTAYVENETPSAWRLFYFYDTRQSEPTIYVTLIEPHS